jgi:hypothetical protein
MGKENGRVCSPRPALLRDLLQPTTANEETGNGDREGHDDTEQGCCIADCGSDLGHCIIFISLTFAPRFFVGPLMEAEQPHQQEKE